MGMAEDLAKFKQMKADGKIVEGDDQFQILPAGQQNSSPAPTDDGDKTLNQELAEQAAAEAEPSPATPEKTKKGYKILDQTFETEAEALAFAEQLALEQTKQDAYRAGIKAASEPAKPQQDPEVELLAQIAKETEDKFFENPGQAITEALLKYGTFIKTNIHQSIEQKQVIESTRTRVMQEVFEANPEIANDAGKKLFDSVLAQKQAELGNMPARDALKIIAKETKKLMAEIAEAAKPRIELPNKPSVVPGSGNYVSTQKSIEPKNDEPVDFISQVRKLNKRS